MLEKVKKVPVVILHSGGAKAIEALLLAEACKNVYLDTSFQFHIIWDQALKKIWLLRIKKLALRVLYGWTFCEYS